MTQVTMEMIEAAAQKYARAYHLSAACKPSPEEDALQAEKQRDYAALLDLIRQYGEQQRREGWERGPLLHAPKEE